MTGDLTDRARWGLSQEAFEALLRLLGGSPEESAEKYESLRARLIRHFRWERCPNPEDCADETLNRVARRLSEGEVIDNPSSYFFGVARHIVLESVKGSRRQAQALEHSAHLSRPDPHLEQALACLERCLDQLDPDQRDFILAYYEGERSIRIDGRRRLAESLGLPVNAIRNRALRIRERIESCVKNCITSPGR